MKHQANSCKKPKIIVFTHAYNVEKYILNALQSMISQTYDNWEWYLTDNASTDRTANIIEDFLQAHPDERVHYFKRKYNSILQPGKEEDTFYGKIFPSLIGKGYYITSLDSDDYFEPRALEIMAKPVIEYGVDYVITGRQAFSDKQRYQPDLPVDRIFDNISDLCDIWPQNYVCMRTVWGKLFLLDRYYKVCQNPEIRDMVNGNDTYINLLYQQASRSAASVSKVTVNFCIRQNSLFNSNVFPRRYQAYIKIYQKTISLFREWGRMDAPNLKFAARVLQSSMLETISPTTRDVVAPNALELLHNILTDQTVYQVLNRHELYEDFLDRTFSLLQENAVLPQNIDCKQSEKYFHIWILCALKLQEQDWYLALCCLLHGVFMGTNCYRIGVKHLQNLLVKHTVGDCKKFYSELSASDMEKLAVNNPLIFTAILCRNDGFLHQTATEEILQKITVAMSTRQEQAETERHRQTVLALLQSGEEQKLAYELEHFQRNLPFDYMVLYAKMYLFCTNNNLKAACCVAGIVEYLYPYNQVLVDMAAMILEESGHYRSAYSLYKKNLFYSEESEKDRIQQEIHRLEEQLHAK